MPALMTGLRLLSTASSGVLIALFAGGFMHNGTDVALAPHSPAVEVVGVSPLGAATQCADDGTCADDEGGTEQTASEGGREGTEAAEGRTQEVLEPPGPPAPASAAEDDGCGWWSDDVGRATDTQCSPSALRRMMSADSLSRALERAQRCALAHGTSCVLSHEVDLPLPAALLWDQRESRMRMYLLPRVGAAEGRGHERRVALVRPPFRTTAPTGTRMSFTIAASTGRRAGRSGRR